MEQQKTKESKKRYFAYDLMRAAAMLLIVFYHMNCEWSARLMESSLVVTKIGAHRVSLAGREYRYLFLYPAPRSVFPMSAVVT